VATPVEPLALVPPSKPVEIWLVLVNSHLNARSSLQIDFSFQALTQVLRMHRRQAPVRPREFNAIDRMVKEIARREARTWQATDAGRAQRDLRL
jgi:hypothetical protein